MAALQTALGNYLGKEVRASEGIVVGGTIIKCQTDWIAWQAEFDPTTQTVAPSTQSVSYRKMADQVYLNVNLTFTYTPPGASSNVVTITGFPVPSVVGAKYTNLCTVEGVSVFGDACRFRIDPATSKVALEIVLDNNFVPGSEYTVRGQLSYQG